MADKLVSISFDGSTGTVGTPADVSITKKGKSKIEFDLSEESMPSGASARILGVEFPTTGGKTQPDGTGYTPGSVFEDATTYNFGGVQHTLYGKAKTGSAKDLILTDDDEVPSTGAEQDYPYKVWVQMTMNDGSTAYYSSPDPTIKNKPTT